MKGKQNFMSLLGLIVLTTTLSSCCWHECLLQSTTVPATTLEKDLTPNPIVVTEFTLQGANEKLTVQFEDGKCENLIVNGEQNLDCKERQIELKELFICTSKSIADRYDHEVNTLIAKTELENFPPKQDDGAVFCAPITFLSEGAVFQFRNKKESKEGKNIRCRKSGGYPICPR